MKRVLVITAALVCASHAANLGGLLDHRAPRDLIVRECSSRKRGRPLKSAAFPGRLLSVRPPHSLSSAICHFRRR